MTEYALPDLSRDDLEKDSRLFVLPTEEQDNTDIVTWKDTEVDGQDPDDSLLLAPEVFGHQSIAEHLGRLVIRNRDARGERDNFITSYRWVPYSKQEATVALTKVATQKSIRERTQQGSGIRAVEKLFSKVDAYRANANLNLNTLQEALTTVEEADLNPSTELIKDNKAVRGVLSEFMLGKESLDAFVWMNRTSRYGRDRKMRAPNQRRKERLAQIDSLFDKASDEDLKRLWLQAFISNQQRLRFWNAQMDDIRGFDPVSQGIVVSDHQQE
jgi:hypothetical protein